MRVEKDNQKHQKVEDDHKPGAKRVIRGGSWNNKARNCRCVSRNWNHPDNRNDNLGFRCARAHDRVGRPEPEQIVLPAIREEWRNQKAPGVLVV